MFEKTRKNDNKQTLPKFPLGSMEYTIRNVRYLSKTSISFTLDIEGLVLYSLRVVEGKDGMFLGMPSDKGSDGNYYPKYNLYLTEADSKALIEKVVEAYHSTLNSNDYR